MICALFRLMESFDAFLIQLPREMRTNDCPINKSKHTSSMNMPSIEPSSELGVRPSIESIQPLKISKRKRPNSYRPCSESDEMTNGGFEKRKRPNTHTSGSMIQIMTSQSNNSSSMSQSVAKIGRELRVRQIVSKVTRTTSSSSLVVFQNGQLNERTFRSLNSQQKQIAASQYPKVLIPKLQVKQTKPKKRVSFKIPEVEEESQSRVIRKENVLPKRVNERRKAIDDLHPREDAKTVIKSNLKPSADQRSANLSTERAIITRFSPRKRVSNSYRCSCCDFQSSVRSNFERHQLFH